MKLFAIAFTIILTAGLCGSAAFAGNCYSDPVVKRWLEDREIAAKHAVQLWAQGRSPGDFVSHVAVILSNEFYIFSQCREQPEFLETHIFVINGGTEPKVETVPAIVLEHLVGRDILSPWNQFPSSYGEGMVTK